MPKLRSNVIAYRSPDAVENQTFQLLSETQFQPLGFFVWGVNPGTFIRKVTVGNESVGWVRGRSAMLFVPALPYQLIREIAHLDPTLRGDGWRTERYQAFPVARAGTYLAIEFEGVAQEIAFWGLHLEGGA